MRKIYLLLICFFTLTAFGQTYQGNGKNGFGGTVGQGSLTFEFRGDSVHFTFTKGPGAFNDAAVIYLMGSVNNAESGFSSTANFTDEGDGLRKAISGLEGSNRSVLSFANGFLPDIAIAFDANFAGLFELKENGAHKFMAGGNLQPKGDKEANIYKFSFQVGGDNEANSEFRFLVTYISETGYRSNEFIGDTGPTDNPGFNPYVSTTYATGLMPFSIKSYRGNGKEGFGGAIGGSILRILERGDSTFIIFTQGPGNFNDIVVMYAQGNVPGHPTGISSTANFIDHSDRFRTALSGFNGNDRSLLTFPNIFKPDMAFVFDNNSAAMFSLVENGNHIHEGNLSLKVGGTNDAPVYTIGFETPGNSMVKNNSGISDKFGFLVTYISETAFRSNEFIGDNGPDNNPGWTPYVATTFAGYIDLLPVTLMSFDGRNVNRKVNLQWSSSQESNIDRYEILRSADGKNFSKIGAVSATNKLMAQGYIYEDISPLSGNNFYKLGIVSKDGHVEFSKIVLVKYNSSTSRFKAYTTSSNRVLNIELSAAGAENCIVEMTNSVGQKVFQSRLIMKGSQLYTFDINRTLPAGIYAVSVSSGGERLSQMILVK
jgi:hypothetical protein